MAQRVNDVLGIGSAIAATAAFISLHSWMIVH